MSKRATTSDFRNEDLESEFDYESELDRAKKLKKRKDFLQKEYPGEIKPPGRDQAKTLFDEEHGKLERKQRRFLALDVYSRHKEMINQYYLYYPGATKRIQRDASRDKTDLDVIREHHKFIWPQGETQADDSWECRLAKRYYDKLFKEYCIVDLRMYKENKFAMRWRTEAEVIEGKGQFICGGKKCENFESLTSWEVNFAYLEADCKKNALVKVRLCDDCSLKLNYHNQKKKAVKKKRATKVRAKVKDGKEKELAGSSSSINTTKSENQEESGSDSKTAESVDETKRQFSETEAKEIWSQPVIIDEHRTKEDEFEEFLDDLLM